jgi:spore coat protein U-like protein
VRITRFVLAACCALMVLGASAQQRAKPPASCPVRAADCQINVQVFDFGRGQMSQTAPPINGHSTVSVTCTRAPQANGLHVDVAYELKAIPPAPARQMRDNELRYLRYDMFVDPARTRYWGDGVSYGTFTLQGALMLDDRNRVGTLVHQIYGRVDGGQSLTPPGQWLGLVVVRLEYSPNCH